MSIRMHDKWYKELQMRLPHLTTGKTFYVDKSGSDANSGRYQFAPKLTIQSAVDACTTNKGDIVVVGAGIYYENVRITKSKMTLMGAQTGGKESVSIRPAGVGTDGATVAEASPLYGYSSLVGVDIRGAAVTINAASVELCGLQFDGSGMKYTVSSTAWYAYTGVYVGDGTRINATYNYDCNGSYIHDCIFKRGAHGIEYDGAAEDHRLTDNLFYRQEGATTKGCVFICPGSSRQCERIHITNNVFNAIEDSAYGIYMYNTNNTKNCLFAFNVFAEKNDQGITFAIKVQGTGDHNIVGNWFACDQMVSASNNDHLAGNYQESQGANPKFVLEE